MEVLKTEALTKIYGEGESKVTALDNANISVRQGEFAAIVGTSGSGKSTLLHMLGGLDRPTSGKVFVENKDIFSLKDEALTIFRRRKIGFVFQSFNLVPTLNVYENIVFPIQLDGNDVDEKFVGEVIRSLGLESMQNRLPNQLSGGQQQRVAIARALAAKPAIILADEPTGNLDSRTSQDVLSLLKVTGQKFSQTIVMITHNEAIAQEIMTSLDRGVTGLYGSGMYTGKDKRVLLCICSNKDLVEIKDIVKKHDPKAFFVVGNVDEAMGEGFLEEWY